MRMSQNLLLLRYSIVPAGFEFDKDIPVGIWNRRKNFKNNDSISFRSFVAFGRWNIVFEEDSF